ncbi:MAG: phosphoglucosamine mutase [Deltaproteobacteria bacterium]|nr:phosphoglucosamine mutase [Deltaproteobacteria bacterium]
MSGIHRKLFGTDGVRGQANVHPMTAEVALALGQAIAHVFRGRGTGRHRILIGKDTRLSGYMFEDALAAGICSMGVDVIHVGPMPTPALAFLTCDMRADAGVMITASHNPYQDNGIKFFGRDGFKLPDEIELRIEQLIESGELASWRAPADEVGRATRIDDVEGRYIVFLKNTFPRDITLDGIRVVLDCANGAAYKVGPTLLRELGAEVFALGVEPNGRNINDDCGSLHPQNTIGRLHEVRADVGIAVDGDADRVMIIDERGEVLDGDLVIALCARHLVDQDALGGGGVVTTVMSNMGLEEELNSMGLHMVRTQVGDRYVVEAMREGGYNLGGEQSGHVIFLDHTTTGDGLMTALQVLAIMARKGVPLSMLAAGFKRYPQVMENVSIVQKKPLEELSVLQDAIAEVETKLGGKGRVLIRYSGTELKARVMVEGQNEVEVREHVAHLIDVLEQELAR